MDETEDAVEKQAETASAVETVKQDVEMTATGSPSVVSGADVETEQVIAESTTNVAKVDSGMTKDVDVDADAHSSDVGVEDENKEEMRCVEISNVAQSIMENELRDVFAEAGSIEEMYGKHIFGKGKVWFVRYKEAGGAQMALFLVGQEMDGKALGIQLISEKTWHYHKASATDATDAGALKTTSTAAMSLSGLSADNSHASGLKLTIVHVTWSALSTRTPLGTVITAPVLVGSEQMTAWFDGCVSAQLCAASSGSLAIEGIPAVTGEYVLHFGQALHGLRALALNGAKREISEGKSVRLTVSLLGASPPVFESGESMHSVMSTQKPESESSGKQTAAAAPIVNEVTLLQAMKAQLESKYASVTQSAASHSEDSAETPPAKGVGVASDSQKDKENDKDEDAKDEGRHKRRSRHKIRYVGTGAGSRSRSGSLSGSPPSGRRGAGHRRSRSRSPRRHGRGYGRYRRSPSRDRYWRRGGGRYRRRQSPGYSRSRSRDRGRGRDNGPQTAAPKKIWNGFAWVVVDNQQNAQG